METTSDPDLLRRGSGINRYDLIVLRFQPITTSDRIHAGPGRRHIDHAEDGCGVFYENPVWVLSQVHQQPDTYCQSIRNKKEQNG